MTKVLQRPTLILNRNWQPVNVATVARALVLLWNESARVVDAHPDPVQDVQGRQEDLLALVGAQALQPGTPSMHRVRSHCRGSFPS